MTKKDDKPGKGRDRGKAIAGASGWVVAAALAGVVGMAEGAPERLDALPLAYANTPHKVGAARPNSLAPDLLKVRVVIQLVVLNTPLPSRYEVIQVTVPDVGSKCWSDIKRVKGSGEDMRWLQPRELPGCLDTAVQRILGGLIAPTWDQLRH